MAGFGIWAGLLTAVGLVWLWRHLEVSRAGRGQHLLHAGLYEGRARGEARVSVIVAAKDEEENIGPCVQTMLGQEYPNFEMIVVDDRSTDGTGRILEELARQDGRLRVVRVDQLREGWFGKNNAMREGAARADGQWLCFSDADCRYTSPRLLSVAVGYATEKRLDFLSVLPVLETRGVWERIVQPACGAVMVFWFRPERVNNPRSRTAYANGAFMLLRREAYERLGGHEPVKAEVNEDMHLARLAKGLGLRLEVAQNRGLYQTRMYSRLGQMWRGWSRIFYGCFGSLGRLAATLGFLVVFSLSPWASALAGWAGVAARGLGQGWGWFAVAVAGTAAAGVQWTVLLRFYRLLQADPRYAISYPVGALVCAAAVVGAMLKRLGAGTTWRGTRYRGKRVVRQA